MSSKFVFVLLLSGLSMGSLACGDDATEANNEPINNGSVNNGVNNGSNNGTTTGTNNGTTGTNNGTTNPLDELPPQPWSIDEPGHFNIGYTRWDITYDAAGEAGRELRVVAWYPTLDEEGDSARYANLIRRDEAFKDATPALNEPLPVLIFSHGNVSIAEQSYFMAEYFASHGWLVVAPDHTGNTFFDANDNADLGTGAKRPQDITAVIDYLEALPAGHMIEGLPSDDIVLTGHSFGGYTTLAATGAGYDVDYALAECMTTTNALCDLFDIEGSAELFRAGFNDPRIDVAIPQTPGGYIVWQDGLADISTPSLVMTAALDATLPNAEEGDPIWEAMTGPHIRYDMTLGGHFTYSNMCTLLGGFEEVQNDGCSDQFIDPEKAYDIINQLSMAFARFHLWGDDTYIDRLNGTDPKYSADGELSLKPGALN